MEGMQPGQGDAARWEGCGWAGGMQVGQEDAA